MLQIKSLDSVKIISINRALLLSKLRQIAQSVKSKHTEICDIILFGSIAKNEEVGTSDVDLVIIIEESKEDIFKRILTFKKWFYLELPVDILVYTEGEIKGMIDEDNAFIKNILREGISLLHPV